MWSTRKLTRFGYFEGGMFELWKSNGRVTKQRVAYGKMEEYRGGSEEKKRKKEEGRKEKVTEVKKGAGEAGQDVGKGEDCGRRAKMGETKTVRWQTA